MAQYFGITKADVLRAILDMTKEGIPVSINNIKFRIGGSTKKISECREEIYQEFFANAYDVSQMLIKFAVMESRMAELIALQAESNQLIASLQRRVEECESNRRDLKSQAVLLAQEGVSVEEISRQLKVHKNEVQRWLKTATR